MKKHTRLCLLALLAIGATMFQVCRAQEPVVLPDQSSTAPEDDHERRHRHHGDDVVSIGHNAVLEAGEHADSVVAVLGSATSAGEVRDSVVSVLGNTHVTGPVQDGAVAVLGNVYVNSAVDGDVVAVLGNVQLGPQARIHGNVVVVLGGVSRDANATIDGHVQTVFGYYSGEGQGLGWFQEWVHRCLLYGRPLAFEQGMEWTWTVAIGLLALYVLIALLFRETVESCARILETHPGRSVLAAVVTMLLTPVVVVLLCITVLGVLAIPFLAVALLCAAVFGKIVVLAWIGRRCTPFLAGHPVAHTVLGVVLGGLVALLLYSIPLVGLLVYKVLGVLGLGAVIYALLLGMRASQPPAARAAGLPPGGVPPTGTSFGGATPGTAGPSGMAAGGAAMGSAASSAAFGGTASGGPASSAAYGNTAAQGPAPGAAYSGGAAGEPAPGMAHGGPSMAGPAPGVPPGGATTGGADPYTNAGSAAAAHSSALHGAALAALPRASFWIRMAALLLDALLIGILLHQVRHGVNLSLVALATYGAVMWKLKSSTVGGIVCGLHVVRIDGRPIDWATAIVRALSCFLSLAVAGLGFFWIAIDADRQAWHDKIAGTVVVRTPKGASLV